VKTKDVDPFAGVSYAVAIRLILHREGRADVSDSAHPSACGVPPAEKRCAPTGLRGLAHEGEKAS